MDQHRNNNEPKSLTKINSELNMKQHIKILLLAVIPAITFSSCSKDDKEETPANYLTNGVYIVNEGSFGAGNSSVS